MGCACRFKGSNTDSTFEHRIDQGPVFFGERNKKRRRLWKTRTFKVCHHETFWVFSVSKRRTLLICNRPHDLRTVSDALKRAYPCSSNLSRCVDRSQPTLQDLPMLLQAYRAGDRDALNGVFPLVYRELHSMAHRHRLRWKRTETLNTTSLIHEAYLRLVENQQQTIQNQAHFFALASRVMRSVVLDHAKSKNRLKRGGQHVHVPLEFALDISEEDAEQVLELDEALNKLENHDERMARIIEMRVFGGMSLSETAAALEISVPTVTRTAKTAQVWLYRFMEDERKRVHHASVHSTEEPS